MSVSWLGYLIYASSVLVAFGAWFLLIRALRQGAPRGLLVQLKRSRSFQPVEQILGRSHYRFSVREWVGWAVVLIVMLVAPLVSYWLGDL